jgi:hypothetical protein
MTEPLGHLLRTTKPVSLTFYDWHKTYPFSTTFYVRDEEPEDLCEQLVRAVKPLSKCILANYTIGHRKFSVAGQREELEQVTEAVMGWQKWAVKYRVRYRNGLVRARQLTIPGAYHELTMSAEYGQSLGRKGRDPNPQHPLWAQFLETFRAICVSSEGFTPESYIELAYTTIAWPPKGWKKGG